MYGGCAPSTERSEAPSKAAADSRVGRRALAPRAAVEVGGQRPALRLRAAPRTRSSMQCRALPLMRGAGAFTARLAPELRFGAAGVGGGWRGRGGAWGVRARIEPGWRHRRWGCCGQVVPWGAAVLWGAAAAGAAGGVIVARSDDGGALETSSSAYELRLGAAADGAEVAVARAVWRCDGWRAPKAAVP